MRSPRYYWKRLTRHRWSEVDLDEGPTQWGEPFRYTAPNGNVVVMRVHKASDCVGDHCVIHNPSDHRMRDFPLLWRSDRRIFERICPHGIGHPDPDGMLFLKFDDDGVHGCDGCCIGVNYSHEPSE